MKSISSIARWPARRAATVAVSNILLKSLCSNTISFSSGSDLDTTTALAYSNMVMQTSQQVNQPKFVRRASLRQRIIAAIVCAAIVVFFGIFALAGRYGVDMGRWLGYCGFKQRTGLTCPGCGMTTAALAFARGRIREAFYIQPAGGLLCSVMVVVALLAFAVAVFGAYFRFIQRFFAEVKLRYMILALLIVLAAGWAVTLARALATKT